MEIQWEMLIESKKVNNKAIEAWVPISSDFILTNEQKEHYIKENVLRANKKPELTKQVFICKLFFDKNTNMENVLEQRESVKNYLENELNHSFHILIIPIIYKYKEPEFIFYNISTDFDMSKFEELKNEINNKYCLSCGKSFKSSNEKDNVCSEKCFDEDNGAKQICLDNECENEIITDYSKPFCSVECLNKNTLSS